MRKNAFFLVTCISLLFAIGLLMVFNTTSAVVLDRHLDISTHYALIKQLLYACLSIMAALVVYYFGYQKILSWTPHLFYFLFVLLILVFIPGFGQQLNGSYRWIVIGPFSLGQPSEFMKVIMPLYFIHLISKKGEGSQISWQFFYRIMAVFASALFLILMEPDNGTVAIVMMTMIALFFISRIRLIYWLLPILLIGGIGCICAMQMTYVKERIRVYLNPELDLLGKGHQPYQAKIAAGSGKLFGRGVGESLQKLNYLPEARSDYIAAIYAEEFGFAGVLFLVLLYMIIAYIGFHIAASSKDKNGFYIAAILTFIISFQAFLNLGVVSGLLPSKGINLPFFSQGGSSLMANTIALTLIVHIAKDYKREKKIWKKIRQT